MIYCGDCLDVMRGMEPNSVDAIVTDPPYGLEFMGKEWDRLDTAHAKRDRADELSVESKRPFLAHSVSYQRGKSAQDWHYAWAVEALRIAKPGCHLLAFGGTRTFHRLACAIEDAGWEIRDTLMYVYGSGFPKSHNIGCKCGGNNGAEPKAERDMRPMRDADVSSPIPDQETTGQVLFEDVPEQGISKNGAEARNGNDRPGQSGMEGRGNILSEARELQANQICPLPDGVLGDGPEGRLCDGASPDSGDGNRKGVTQGGGRPSQEPRPAGQSPRKPRTVCVESETQKDGGGTGRVCPTCGGLLDRVGYGSALKPAWEPIIMARKPLDGTVAANVQKWGTGAINIDGCRIPSGGNVANTSPSHRTPQDGWDRPWRHDKEAAARTYAAKVDGNRKAVEQGRWPSNLCHDGSEEVLELFPETNGVGHYRNEMGPAGKFFGGNIKKIRQQQWNLEKSGSAARFFYCAKASRAEREAGCEGMEERPSQCAVGMKQVTAKNWGDGNEVVYERTTKARNFHPTVKPLALMRYLCRLVTPPNGLILDPFMGSGTTGMAAKIEGFRFIGIEQEQEYVDIAERRIAHVGYQMEIEGRPT